MISLLLRNLFYTIIQPGVVAGLIPFLIARKEFRELFRQPLEYYQWIAFVIILAGVLILLHCVYLFAKYGKGTLSPIDPTKRLVIRGMYRYSRNPMYLAMLTILLGETLLLKSFNLAVYMFIIAIAFYLFVVFHEEPGLQSEYGDAYKAYREQVRRWI